MEITARQLGRIEAACYALAKLAERNEVGTVLVNTIREQLDEIEQTADPYELNNLPAPPSGRPRETQPDLFDAAGTLREQIRDFGRQMLERGEGLIPTLRAVCGCYELTQAELARMLGASRTAVCLAFHDRKVRQILLARCAEFFGADGGAGESPEKEA